MHIHGVIFQGYHGLMFKAKWEKLKPTWTPLRDKLCFVNDKMDLLSRLPG